jgi:hypothetical protein
VRECANARVFTSRRPLGLRRRFQLWRTNWRDKRELEGGEVRECASFYQPSPFGLTPPLSAMAHKLAVAEEHKGHKDWLLRNDLTH